MASGCERPDCTVTDTGTCLLDNDPASCPHRLAAEDTEAHAISEIVLPDKATFPHSRACTLSDARGLMAERYVPPRGYPRRTQCGEDRLSGELIPLRHAQPPGKIFLCGQPHTDGLRGNQSRCPTLERRSDSGSVYRPHSTAGQPYRWIPAPQAHPQATGTPDRSALFRFAGGVDHGAHRPKPSRSASVPKPSGCRLDRRGR